MSWRLLLVELTAILLIVPEKNHGSSSNLRPRCPAILDYVPNYEQITYLTYLLVDHGGPRAPAAAMEPIVAHACDASDPPHGSDEAHAWAPIGGARRPEGSARLRTSPSSTSVAMAAQPPWRRPERRPSRRPYIAIVGHSKSRASSRHIK